MINMNGALKRLNTKRVQKHRGVMVRPMKLHPIALGYYISLFIYTLEMGQLYMM